MFGSIFASIAELYKLLVIEFFTTISLLYKLSIFSLTVKDSCACLTSMLLVLLIGKFKLTTVLDPSESFFKIKDSSRPE